MRKYLKIPGRLLLESLCFNFIRLGCWGRSASFFPLSFSLCPLCFIHSHLLAFLQFFLSLYLSNPSSHNLSHSVSSNNTVSLQHQTASLLILLSVFSQTQLPFMCPLFQLSILLSPVMINIPYGVA